MTKNNTIIYIYALLNPLDNNVFYVGATKNAKIRYRGHLYKTAYDSQDKIDLIAGIIASGNLPEMIILDECPVETATFWEDFYHCLMKSFGFNILRRQTSAYTSTFIKKEQNPTWAWNFENLIGKKFNRLTVKEMAYRGDTHIVYNCLCDCGNMKLVRAGNLRTNQVKSCGCLHREMLVRRNKTHGLTNHPLHKLWFKIKERCENTNCKNYHNYGGRGIKVCDKWQIFQNFYDDMINGYKKGLEIDRENNNGDYSPSNCRWVTHTVNTQNTRKTKLSVAAVAEIRSSNEVASYFAKKYNTSKSVINRARSHKTWI